MPRTLIIIVILAITLTVLIGLFRQISDALSAGGRLERSAEEVGKLQQENIQLKNKLAESQSYESWEKTARDHLNLSKPGEVVVMIPKEEIDKQVRIYEIKDDRIEIPNWQGWINLFF